LRDSDVPEYTQMLYDSFNAWYGKRGWGKNYFLCTAQDTSVFYDIYNDLSPGCSVAAFDRASGHMLGACFYHPRETHVSLGIMVVHRDHGRKGIGRSMVEHILGFTRANNYPCCRLVGSAMNMDSFSLYNRSGFVPRAVFHDMVVTVPESGLDVHVPSEDRVRDAVLSDVARMGDLEMDVSGIKREVDYRYAIESPRKLLHAAVCENNHGGIDGFMFSLKHPTLNMLGPCVARSSVVATALVRRELERFRGTVALMLVPVVERDMVEEFYRWGGVNVEIHLQQIWGEFRPVRGVNMPSFLPESG
jgi:GNAT superfamily N-acetyltransferase